jgi:predicted TIM-barrel fold metal-dependent hydrolase
MTRDAPASTDWILDAHSHAFPDAIAAHAVRTLTATAKWQPVQAWHDGTVKGLLDSMDRAGIRRTLMCSIATRPTQVTNITDWSASATSDRILAFASIHPDYPRPEAEVERIASRGLRGLKFHPYYQDCPADDPRVVRIVRAAVRHDLAVVCHAGYDLGFAKSDIASPRRIRNLFEAAPGLRLLACHLGGWHDWDESLRHIVGQPIYLETSFCLGQCPPETLRRILERHPPEYLTFGTDAPWADGAAELALFKALPLGREAMRRALWDNGCRFAGIKG